MHARKLAAAAAVTLLGAWSQAAFSEGYGQNVMVDRNASAAGSAQAMGANAAPKTVGGAPMYSAKDIVDNAVNSKDHTTLVAAVKAAGLVDTLKSAGPFTVFAPTNAAFSALPAGAVDNLLKPENKAALSGVLTYHVVPGRIDAADLADQIRMGGGKAMLKTAAGGTLTATMRGKQVVVTDAKGNAAVVTIADVYQSNGVIHVVDKVLMPG
jgi:uncharacterized surface protein with fasciclin (FAS1) repeats